MLYKLIRHIVILMSLVSAIITLILVMDPFGNISIFMSVLSKTNPKRRTKILIREMLIALATLTFFLFFGKYVLHGLHISKPALRIAGGIVLLMITVKMIFPSKDDKIINDDSKDEPFIVPLAIPMVAGPSSMAIVILLSTSYPEQMEIWFAALLCAWFFSAVILILSEKLAKILGDRAIRAIERLMGMILITMAVQLLLTGVQEYLELVGVIAIQAV